MSLTGALHLGRSGLVASQTALQAVGNNLANAATEGYTRQKAVAVQGPSQQIQPGVFTGTGVRIEQIARQVNEALNGRIRTAEGDHHAALAQHRLLSQVESIYDDLGDASLTQRLERFFESWSQVAANPTDTSLQAMAVTEGQALATYMRQLNGEVEQVGEQIDQELRTGVAQVNALLDRVASLNQQIARLEGGAGGAHSLRDERDRVLKELGQHIDISTVERPAGTVDIYVGSTPLLTGVTSRGVKLDFLALDEGIVPQLRSASEGDLIEPRSGKLTQLIESRANDVGGALQALDTLAHQLIYQLNQVHSSGQSGKGFGQLTGTVGSEHLDVPLNEADFPFEIRNGSFLIHVTEANGQRTGHRIEIDLNNNGNGTTLEDVVAAIDNVDLLNASLTVDGRVRIEGASSDVTFSFSEDTSGFLATVGLNTFFTGKAAADMGVNEVLEADPTRLAVSDKHLAGDNGTATQIAGLLDRPVEDLGGLSLRGYWSQHVEGFASRTSQAGRAVEATMMISESLQAQWQAHSGVNVDEEAIDMLTWQRTYQGSARFITVIDEMMQTLLNMTR